MRRFKKTEKGKTVLLSWQKGQAGRGPAGSVAWDRGRTRKGWRGLRARLGTLGSYCTLLR